MKRRLNTFLSNCGELRFGSYILFQEYKQGKHNGIEYCYSISKPIMAIYIACYPCDQTLEFAYLVWANEARLKNPIIGNHAEWNDYIDILGKWDNKPSYREILKAYRGMTPTGEIKSSEMNWPSYEAESNQSDEVIKTIK